jgi:HK97 family phage major capsid protein
MFNETWQDDLNGTHEAIDLIEDQYGSDPAKMPAGQRERHERLSVHLRDVAGKIQAKADREIMLEKLNSGEIPNRREPGFSPTPTSRTTSGPWDYISADSVRTESEQGWVARAHDAIGHAQGLSDEGREKLANAADAQGGQAGMLITALSNPAYRAAFEKILRNPERAIWSMSEQERDAVATVEAARATLTTNTNTAGWTIPLSLNPSLSILTNNGAANPFRAVARQEVAISSPHRMIKSAGVTAEWLAEGIEAADASPVFSKVDVNLFKQAVWLSASVELLDDSASAISNAIPQLLADARNRLEAAAFVNGTGSTSPLGAIYSVGAVTASRVATTTSGAFGLVDVYKAWNALPAVARQSAKLGWMAGNATISSIRQFDTAGSAAFWTDLSQGTPANLLGAPIFEASEMTTATTSGSDIVIVGDWSAFAIVDHIAGASLEYIPALMGSNQRPTFTSGWQYHHRVGSAVLDESKFRLLRT